MHTLNALHSPDTPSIGSNFCFAELEQSESVPLEAYQRSSTHTVFYYSCFPLTERRCALLLSIAEHVVAVTAAFTEY